jgi:hypothetical protein
MICAPTGAQAADSAALSLGFGGTNASLVFSALH